VAYERPNWIWHLTPDEGPDEGPDEH
jgi:hypothetical protein